MNRLCLYFIKEKDRWIKSDRYIRPFIRRIIRGKPVPGGVEKVFINLTKGLDEAKIPYEVNLPFHKVKPDDKVAVLGIGREALQGYSLNNPVVAGIGLMTHPSEWPDLCEQYPVVKYLQHSEWANNVYKPYFGDRCQVWPVGINTRAWRPAEVEKKYDVLIYNKIRWNTQQFDEALVSPIKALLAEKKLRYKELRYGSYTPEVYLSALQESKSMIFLCEHESQGIALCEALSTAVPVLAWDQGWCLDPNRFAWGTPEIKATSVPFFDERCGARFKDVGEFLQKFQPFWEGVESRSFSPREYILDNLTLEKSARNFAHIVHSTK